jgi:CBS domain containing-hemolysin-like protein
LKNILPEMTKNGYSNIPVYDENENFMGILNDSRLLYWISDLLINNDYIDLSLTKV